MFAGKYSLLILLCCSSLLAGAKDDYRIFTNDAGSEIEAKITESSEADLVTLERRDGRTFRDVSIELFSEKDRKYIAKWQKKEAAKFNDADLKPDTRLTINVLKGRNDSFNNYGDIDDRVVSFDPRVVVDNEELRYSYKSVPGTLLVVGENIMDKGQYVVISRQDFKISLPKRKKVEWEGKPFQCRYDPDYGGYEYGGYLVALRDKEGKVVKVKASKTIWEKNAKRLLKAKKRTGYSRDFKHSSKLRTTYGLD